MSEHDHTHDHHGDDAGIIKHVPLMLSIAILLVMMILEFGFDVKISFLPNIIIHLAAYILAGYNVLMLAARRIARLDIFNEFVLMTVATLGAFYIGAYSEGVAVMVFYCIGEWFQDKAVAKAKKNIKSLIDIRPAQATIIRSGVEQSVHSRDVALGDELKLLPGERVALDGILNTPSASFNTAALTGESVPQTKHAGEVVLAGMINLNMVSSIRVTAAFKDSRLSRILEMVQDATSRKSRTQLFISKLAKVYTPIVFFLALCVCVVPYFISDNYVFETWFYRALVFLVISCPCALVISIPLGYFGGIGLASRNGILFKGANFLDIITKVDTVVMDKTGTLTKGVFSVRKVVAQGLSEDELLSYALVIEKNSNHPVAKAVVEYAERFNPLEATSVEEIPAHGLSGKVNGKNILLGNARLMKLHEVVYPATIEQSIDTTVIIAIDEVYAGHIFISDIIKEDAAVAVKSIHALGIKTVILSGDKQNVVDDIASRLGIDEAHGELLPEDKVKIVERLKSQGRVVAFVGDGINDAPVIALADVGMAMGGLGSDAAIETADLVIQNDQPSKITKAIRIGKITRRIVWQNIILALVIKGVVLILGAGGIATLWEAVIADVGVALIAILNAVRIQQLRL